MDKNGNYLSSHYYKAMRLISEGNGKDEVLRLRYQKDMVKDWWLNSDIFVNDWAKPQIERIIDEEVNKMIEKALNGTINVKMNVWNL